MSFDRHPQETQSWGGVVREPSLDEFYSLIEQAQKTAAQLGLTEDDIAMEIKAMRAEKRMAG